MGPWLVVLTVVKTAAACRCEVAALLGCLALASTGLDLRLYPAQAWDAPVEVDGAIGVDVEIGLPVALQLGATASSDSCTDLAGQDSPPQVSESSWGASRAAGCEVSTFAGGASTAQAWEREIEGDGAI